MSKPLPERLRYAADHKNYACVDPKCKAHHDAEYLRIDLHESALTTIRQEERAAERKRALDVIKRVPATAAGADAFRKRLIEELYVEVAANETREDGDDG